MSTLEHGGRIDEAIARFGGARADWLDLSTGINPRPWPVPDIPQEAWSRLPDQCAEEQLIGVARAHYGVRAGVSLVAANGTQALIQVLPRVLETRDVAILSPTYGEYQHVFGPRAKPVAGLDERPASADTLIVVNPNNPTGEVLPVARLRQAALHYRHLVVDEAFADPEPAASLVPEMPDNTIVLRSFGKFFGLAGIRLGFVICVPEIAEQFRTLLGPWSVSGPALQVGAKALADSQWIGETRARLKTDSQVLADMLLKAGFSNVTVNSLFVSAKAPPQWNVFEKLARKHILIRAFKAQPGFYRFGIWGSEDAFSRLEKALQGLGDG